MTKAAIQTSIFDNFDKDKGYNCPCCGLFVKRYTRTFNSNMAVALITLYNSRNEGFVHLESLMAKKGFKRCGDASYLRHYKMIEALTEDREDGSPRNGYYKITSYGILACELKTTFQEHFQMFNNKCEGFTGLKISITYALGKKFNYNELMGIIPSTHTSEEKAVWDIEIDN